MTIPAAIGFAFGGIGMVAVDFFMPAMDAPSFVDAAAKRDDDFYASASRGSSAGIDMGEELRKQTVVQLRDELEARGLTWTSKDRKAALVERVLAADEEQDAQVDRILGDGGGDGVGDGGGASSAAERAKARQEKAKSWHRIVLLVIAITLHNFPEGMAVGVGFGAINASDANSTEGIKAFANARNLAIGIGLQNFPEGLAVSMPLRREGVSLWRSFWYGQLSGLVEPFGGILGAWLVQFSKPILPYALSFAAGAMVYVVVDDLIPEAHREGNSRLATLGCMVRGSESNDF